MDLLKGFDKVGCQNRILNLADGLIGSGPNKSMKESSKHKNVCTDLAKIVGTSHFTNDLGLDSLDTVEVVMAIEEVRSSSVYRPHVLMNIRNLALKYQTRRPTTFTAVRERRTLHRKVPLTLRS